MRRSKRLVASIAVLVLTLGVGVAPPAMAQEEECALLTVAEVESALGATGLEATGSSTFCSFSSEGLALLMVVQPGGGLDTQREQYPDGTDTTIAGAPALVSEASRTIAVELPGQVLSISHYAELPWADAAPILTGLLELAIPRVPAGPSPEDIARLEALIPATINGSPITIESYSGDLLFAFMEQTDPGVIALNEAMAAQGKVAADVLFVGGETESEDDEYSVVAVLIKGADASQLVQPLFGAFAASGDEAATFTPIEVGGRSAVRIKGAAEETLVAATSGDVILAASVPEAELESVLAALP